MNRSRLRLVLLLATTFPALSGCAVWDWGLQFWGLREKPQIVATRSPTPENRVIATPATSLPKVHLFKLSIPVGTVSANEKVWRQLNEDALDSQTSVLLAQNGMRAGVGPVGRWEGIAKVINVPGAASEEFLCQTDGRSNLNVVVRNNVPEQIIVSIDRDNVQQGRTFEKCDNVFRLSMNLSRSRPDLTIALEPVVLLGTIQVSRSVGPGGAPPMGVVAGTQSQEVPFADMRLATAVRPDQFLIVAPADPKANRFSIGTRFLSNNDTVPATETVLVFVPAAETPHK